MSDRLKSSVRVLIVEDNVIVASILQEIVSMLGYAVIGPAGDQHSAYNLTNTTRIDAALISVSLLSAAEDSVANHLVSRCIPFALITDYSDHHDFGNGESPLLPKPFTGLQMATLLEKLLEKKY